MKSVPLSRKITAAGLALMASPVIALAQAPQAPKPAPEAPKPPVHKPEQSILNRLKQDDRSKATLKETVAKLREAAKNNETAEKELKRLDLKNLKEDPAKVLDSIKDQLSPEATAELKAALEKAKQSLNSEEAKKMIEEAKKKAAASIKPKSATTTTPPAKFAPSTFDQVPAPVPVAPEVIAKPRTPAFFVSGDSVIFPPTQDPANPKRALPPGDVRSRTYVITGNAQVKTPTMVLEGDRIEMIASPQGNAGGLRGPIPEKPKATPQGNQVDPVRPGLNADDEEKKDAPFDRVIATGRVNIVQIQNGKTQSGKGGSMIYDKKTGNMILTDWPEAQDGKNIITGTRKDARIVLVLNGKSYGEGCTVRDLGEAKAGKTDKPANPAGAPGSDPASPPKAQRVP